MQIVALPELSILEEAPPYIAGLAVRHGQVIPIVDLRLRFNYPVRPYTLEDSIIFLEGEESVIGILADETEAVFEIDERDITAALGEWKSSEDLVAGVVRWQEKVVMVLNSENLLRLSQRLPEEDGLARPVRHVTGYSSQTTAVFRERALKLAEVPKQGTPTESISLAVVRLGEELFGFELAAIREFAALRNVTPVPCCPPHIVGQMNLRGEAVTVVDISKPLGLPGLSENSNQIVAIHINAQFPFGAVVDELLGVIDLTPGQLDLAPRSYVRGTIRYGSRTLSLIDLTSLMAEKSLKVNEKPS